MPLIAFGLGEENVFMGPRSEDHLYVVPATNLLHVDRVEYSLRLVCECGSELLLSSYYV